MYFRSTFTTAVLALVAFAPITAPFASAQAGTSAPAAAQQPQHPAPQTTRSNAPIPQLDVPPPATQRILSLSLIPATLPPILPRWTP